MSYTVRPLSDRTWLRPSNARKPTQFRASWPETEHLLLEEVERLDGKGLVIEVDVREQDLRLNGTLRSNAKDAETPAVVVAFTAPKHGDLLYRCDTFKANYYHQGPDWQHNVRAIAMTLTALRAVDRYGATDTGQQYTGFKALPAGRAMPASAMARDEAVAIIALHSGYLTSEVQPNLERAVRRARAKTHPDANDSDAGWTLVNEAAAVLGVR